MFEFLIFRDFKKFIDTLVSLKKYQNFTNSLKYNVFLL